MDLVVQVPRIPRPGETILGRDFAAFPGGKGANQAVASARLGASVTMIGQVGSDLYGEALIKSLADEGVNVDYVYMDEQAATGVAMISVDSHGQNSIAVASGANFTITSAQIHEAWKKIQEIDILIMPLETPPNTILEAARLAKSRNARVVLNPAPARRLDTELLPLIDVLVPNEHEIFQINSDPGHESQTLLSAAKGLIEQGATSVVTTLGGDGVSIVDRDMDEILISPYLVEVVDTTAAGDSFVAALAVALAEGNTLVDACRYANAVGALTVTKLGAQPSLPTHTEVAGFLEQQEAG